MKNSKLFLEEKGVLLENTSEYALLKNNALKYIKMLNIEKQIILGGDVYEKDSNTKELFPNYDNWYIEKNNLTSNESYKITKSYIENYSKSSVYFIIVTQIPKI